MLKPIDIPLLLLLDAINRSDFEASFSRKGRLFKASMAVTEPDALYDAYSNESERPEAESDLALYEDRVRQIFHLDSGRWSMANLGKIMRVSASTIHDSISRMLAVQLLVASPQTATQYQLDRLGLKQLIIHAIRYLAPARPGAVTRGIPTASSAPVMERLSAASDLAFVWPSVGGQVTGMAVDPLHKSVPYLCVLTGQQRLYELFCLIDALRLGSRRETAMAIELLEQRL